MKRCLSIFFSMSLLPLFSLVLAQEVKQEVKKEEAPKPKYVGVGKCMTCHKMKARGDQYSIWLASKHAKAYESLASEKSLEFAKALSIKEPQKSEKCLKCHVTAFGVDTTQLGEKFTVEEGIGCEACHGAGEFYSKASLKAPKKWEEDPKGMHKQVLDAGLIVPTAETCVKCHNKESPTYKEFKYEEFASKIAHPRPKVAAEKPKSTE